MPELKLKVGADPEYSVLWNGQKVAANEVIRKLFAGDPRLSGHTLKTDGGELGCDGCAETGELRPIPSLDPLVTAGNVGKCLKEFLVKGQAFDLTTLSLWDPIGGHIHLELPPEAQESSIQDWHRNLMSFYLPIMLGEEKASVKIRFARYGKITDYHGPEGSRRTLEVRCPSAEWITTQKLAEATLAYMGVVWHEVIHNEKKLPKALILKSIQQETALQDMAVNGFELATDGIMKEIAKAVRKFEMYEPFKEQIEYVLKPNKILEDKRTVNYSIAEGWGFQKSSRNLTKRLFLSAQKEAPSIDGATFDIFHNDDMRTGFFAEELRKKVASGTKLNHPYYIFGLKKGIKGMLVYGDGKYYQAPDYATKDDIDAIYRTVGKMQDKAQQYEKEKLAIDFKRGRVLKQSNRCVLIGLPFDQREKNDLKPFLEAVWQFEKNNFPEIKLVPKARTPGNPPVQALIPQGEVGTEEIQVDTRSQGSQIARERVETILNDQRVEEQAERVVAQKTQFAALIDYAKTCEVRRWDGSTHNVVVLGTSVRGGEKVLFFDSYEMTGQISENLEVVTPDGRLLTVPIGTFGIHRTEGSDASRSTSDRRPNTPPNQFNVRIRLLNGDSMSRQIQPGEFSFRPPAPDPVPVEAAATPEPDILDVATEDEVSF